MFTHEMDSRKIQSRTTERTTRFLKHTRAKISGRKEGKYLPFNSLISCSFFTVSIRKSWINLRFYNQCRHTGYIHFRYPVSPSQSSQREKSLRHRDGQLPCHSTPAQFATA